MHLQMKKSDFNYDLPPSLIAQAPLDSRSDSRLLVMHRHEAQLADSRFHRLPEYLEAGDLIVFNNTRVIPARLFGHKATGGQVEVFLERVLEDGSFLAMLRSSKKLRPGQEILLGDGSALTYMERSGDFFRLQSVTGELPIDLFQRLGQVPLPPYISRPPEDADHERYQTLFARKAGAVAAPTASLHFDEALLNELNDRGIRSTEITLHVGAGTFLPVRVEDLDKHEMHSEYLEVSEQAVDAIERAKSEGGRIIAAGTTSLRALESASAGGRLKPMQGDTRLFIRPGYRFNTVDGLITNFHLPESTLLMLVSAFAGIGEIRNAYAHAVEQRYRFFSYGDAMLILPAPTRNK